MTTTESTREGKKPLTCPPKWHLDDGPASLIVPHLHQVDLDPSSTIKGKQASPASAESSSETFNDALRHGPAVDEWTGDTTDSENQEDRVEEEATVDMSPMPNSR